jgi:ATP-binding cassette subfamily F protein 3
MSLASIHKASITYAGVRVLDGVSLELAPGAKIGLVGENGSGKSTILKLIAGLVEPDAGMVSIAQSARLGYLPQHPDVVPGRTALEEVLSARPRLLELGRTIAAHEAVGNPASVAEGEAYAAAVAEFAEADGYRIESEARAALAALGLSEEHLAMPVETLSGGENARVQLARVLLTEPSLLLLDEPDNHLDIAGIEWLEETLRRFRGALLMVTHDRALLDAVTDGIMEIERGKLTFERGRFADFMERKRKRFEQQLESYLEQQRRVRKLKAAVSRADGQARGIEQRTTHDYYRHQARKVALRATRIKDRIKRELEGAGSVKKPWMGRDAIRVDMKPAKWHARTVVRMEGVAKSFGERLLFEGVELDVSRGERIALLGPNGSGKTTLMEIALGLQEADDGGVWLSQGATPFYCDQMQGGLDPELTVYETLSSETDLEHSQIHYVLARLLFKQDAVHKRVGDLSGGERTRLLLCLLMNTRADLLMLDEPTNHLDLPGIEVLQQGLCSFEGAVLFISHDRRFLDAVATAKYELRDGTLVKA